MTQPHCTIENIIEALTKLQGKLPSEETLQDPPTSKKATGNNIEEPSERRSGVKKPSLCDRLIKRVKNIGKASNHASDSGGSQGGSIRSGHDSEEDENLVIRKLHSDIRQMKAAFENLAVFQDKMIKNLEDNILSTRLEAILSKTGSSKPRSDDLKEIRRKVFNLKCEIPSLLQPPHF